MERSLSFYMYLLQMDLAGDEMRRVTIRISDGQWSQLKENVGRLGCDMSKYMRSLIFGSPSQWCQFSDAPREDVDEGVSGSRCEETWGR